MTLEAVGWEVVCPDGLVRPAAHGCGEAEAEDHAAMASVSDLGCASTSPDGAPCPGGKHLAWPILSQPRIAGDGAKASPTTAWHGHRNTILA